MPGLHTFVMSSNGIRVIPRQLPRAEGSRATLASKGRASTGLPALDAVMSGGIPRGQSVLLSGPSGTGKSTFARHFIDAGARSGEKGILVAFEEHPGDYLAGADEVGPSLRQHVEAGLVELLGLRPLDLTVDEALIDILDAIERTGARRLAVDSLSGFELALSPAHRHDVRESIFRFVNALTGRGVTVLMTEDTTQSSDLGLSSHITEFLADSIVLLRYVEVDGYLEKVLTVVKMRYSAHDTAIHRYAIDRAGIVMKERGGAPGAIAGVPRVPRERERARPKKKRRS
jgi:circadian clock protein KaiC